MSVNVACNWQPFCAVRNLTMKLATGPGRPVVTLRAKFAMPFRVVIVTLAVLPDSGRDAERRRGLAGTDADGRGHWRGVPLLEVRSTSPRRGAFADKSRRLARWCRPESTKA